MTSIKWLGSELILEVRLFSGALVRFFGKNDLSFKIIKSQWLNRYGLYLIRDSEDYDSATLVAYSFESEGILPRAQKILQEILTERQENRPIMLDVSDYFVFDTEATYRDGCSIKSIKEEKGVEEYRDAY